MPNTNYPLIVTAFIDDDTTINVGSASTAPERIGAKTMVVNPQTVGEARWLYDSWSAAQYFPGRPLSRDELQGDVSSNPVEQSYFIIYIDGGAPGANNTVDFLVQIEYDVTWSETTSLAGS